MATATVQRDIWNDEADTLPRSPTTFAMPAGARGQPWGVRAYVPTVSTAALSRTAMNAPICPRVHVRHSKWKTVREWRELGVVPLATHRR